MQGLRSHIVVLQPLWVIGSDRDQRFLADWAAVDALPESQHVRQLGYILRKTMVAPPSNPGDFTQDRPEQTIKLYASLDGRILASEKRARALGLSGFTQIGRLFDLGGAAGGDLRHMGIAPLEGPGSEVGKLLINGKVRHLPRETIGGYIPTDAMRANDFWGETPIAIAPAPNSDLLLAVKQGATTGGALTSLVVTRASQGWNREILNTKARGRQVQLAMFTRENDPESSYILNPTQGGTSYAEDYHANHPKSGQTVKRIFWQVPPRVIGHETHLDEHGSTVFEITTIPVEFAPDYPESGPEPGNEPVTAGTEEYVAAWVGLRYRDRFTFHYRGLPGVIRRDSFVECDFDLPPWYGGPQWPVIGASWHLRRDEINANTEGFAYDAESTVLTTLHTQAPNLWSLPTPPNAGVVWGIHQDWVRRLGVPVAASLIPSGRGGVILRSPAGAEHAGMCLGLYANFNTQFACRGFISYQHLLINGEIGSRTAAMTAQLAANYEGHPEGGIVGPGTLSWLHGLRAGRWQYPSFFCIGTQAEVLAAMDQLYAWGH